MKKVVSLIVLSMIIMMVSVNVFASDPLLGNETENDFTQITGNEYEDAQNNNNTTTLPQTGVESYGLGMLLIVCAASAMFAYKKVRDYRGI